MKNCLVTGASSGIGRATAIELSKRNYFDNIIIIARDYNALIETRSQMTNKVNVDAICFDLNDLSKIEPLIQEIIVKYGSIDCLLNIAGYTDPQSLLTTEISNIEKTFTINVYAPILLIKECVKSMKNNTQISKILNVASTAGITSRPGWLSYAASKAALISISNTLVDELAEYNIKVYTVSPGRCATSLRRKLAPNEDQTKIMQPDEVAKVISDLVSIDENILDGQNIILRKKNL